MAAQPASKDADVSSGAGDVRSEVLVPSELGTRQSTMMALGEMSRVAVLDDAGAVGVGLPEPFMLRRLGCSSLGGADIWRFDAGEFCQPGADDAGHTVVMHPSVTPVYQKYCGNAKINLLEMRPFLLPPLPSPSDILYPIGLRWTSRSAALRNARTTRALLAP